MSVLQWWPLLPINLLVVDVINLPPISENAAAGADGDAHAGNGTPNKNNDSSKNAAAHTVGNNAHTGNNSTNKTANTARLVLPETMATAMLSLAGITLRVLRILPMNAGAMVSCSTNSLSSRWNIPYSQIN
jgi:hypothetical protein